MPDPKIMPLVEAFCSGLDKCSASMPPMPRPPHST
eukprot:CAMPEP_0174293698 /NCGR_PEP_ID=MMETSP0809-20121228/39439_1 /TAXON_ID=73025 ORGANISM="Eutreptiella gymnastica-like, Strain CCMP1594" /NCGR_SAMPLE_ID=MMETSP0809 /ASSEMBLY_ACC=CAM_ASM_000658 /LENGTH=34 /DNA_ID= /DNA_START= /DNA_END= /DNA_ORIENTATION=